MTNDITASTASTWSRRVRMKRVTRHPSRPRLPPFDAPLLDPQRRRVLVAGGRHALQPSRQHIGIGAEIERQRRQLLGVERLEAVPQRRAAIAVELDLDGVDEPIGLGALEAGIVLAAPAGCRHRDLVGAQRRARHVLGRAGPGEERHGEIALGHALAEQHARRLVLQVQLDADLAPLALQHLLDQLADAVAGGGGEVKRELLARDRKSTRLNSSHDQISYAVFCLKKKKKKQYSLPFLKKKKTKNHTN